MGTPKELDLRVRMANEMLELNSYTRRTLRTALEEEMEALRADKEARAKLDRQIKEHEDRIHALRRLLGDVPVSLEAHEQQESSTNKVVTPVDPRPGTVTDEIRRLFEVNPLVTSAEVIQHIRSKIRKSKIGPQSFSIWNGYFKHGRYRMDKEKYRIRYGQEPPY